LQYSTDCPDITNQPTLATKVPSARAGWKEKPPGRGRAASDDCHARQSLQPSMEQWAKILNEQ